MQAELEAKKGQESALRYKIERQESPSELLKAARRPEFAHLEYPQRDEVVVCGEAL